jgi:hypothetical protein
MSSSVANKLSGFIIIVEVTYETGKMATGDSTYAIYGDV